MRLFISTLAAAALLGAAATDAPGQPRDMAPTFQVPQQVLPQGETRLTLRPGQRLNLVGGDYILLRPDGILEIVEMNGLVVRRLRNASAVRDRSGTVWVVSGGQRIRAGALGR
jgi:hypothetical protein